MIHDVPTNAWDLELEGLFLQPGSRFCHVEARRRMRDYVVDGSAPGDLGVGESLPTLARRGQDVQDTLAALQERHEGPNSVARPGNGEALPHPVGVEHHHGSGHGNDDGAAVLVRRSARVTVTLYQVQVRAKAVGTARDSTAGRDEAHVLADANDSIHNS
ncbi:hypothetical protein ACFZDG_05620 [Kitasatospora xanthocidica]|uniref:hypothetical protein n=1 Tax=Kitasatospora xanthocidica TaxID=83382 RepID=UPI0036E4B963